MPYTEKIENSYTENWTMRDAIGARRTERPAHRILDNLSVDLLRDTWPSLLSDTERYDLPQ